MRIINKKYLLIILLIGIIITGVIVLKSKETIKLDNVILKQEINNNTFAMYKESDNGYEEYKENNFPKDYVLNINKSKCIDNNGNELENVLSYENDKVTITSGNTTYCYLYFDKSLGLEIKEEEPNKLSTEIKGEMYRFQGQQNENVNNYICFGTSDQVQCKSDTDKYMYRIIGIEAETGRVKVIKKEALEQTYQWWDDYDTDIEFPKSKIYKAISGDGFLTNKEYVPEGWENKISDNTWTYGDMLSNDELGAKQTGEGLYKTETGKKATQWRNYATAETPDAIPTTVTYEYSPYKGNIVYYTNGSGNWTESFPGKVSLMYLHDYYLSVSNTANCQVDAGSYAICETGWMNLSQNDSNVKGDGASEWTMSRLGWWPSNGDFRGYIVTSKGYAITPHSANSYSVRPVFFINASEELLSGTGTITDPFIIK